MVPSVALLITSPLRSVSVVVVAPPRSELKPVTLNVPPVFILVLMVVAAETVTATTKRGTRIGSVAKIPFCTFALNDEVNDIND